MAQTFVSLGKVEAIKSLFEKTGYTPFQEPLNYNAEAGVTSASKLFLEGTDFNLVYFPLKHLGYKSVVAVTGELFAALSHPQSLSVVLGVSAKLDFEQIKQLWDGIVVAAREFGYASLSLELVPSRNGLAISINAGGARSAKLTQKQMQAQTKDLLCISGSLGAAYLGQQLLEQQSQDLDKYKMQLAAYLKPELGASTLLRLEEAGICPSAAYFVSNGLSDAVLRLQRDTKLGAKIYADKMPFEGNSFAIGKQLNIDPFSAAMNGGDDYKLLLAIPISQYESFRKDFQVFDIIGHLALPEAGAVLVTPDGLEHQISAPGWK